MKRLLILPALLVAGGLLFAGAAKESPAASSTTAMKPAVLFDNAVMDDSDKLLPLVNPLQASGAIITAGSSTVYPLSERMVERFKKEGFGGNVTVDSIGSGAGLERFTKTGETDVANSSRKIQQKEIDQAAAIGRTPIEFRVGTDALAVVVSKANTFVTNVTKDELIKIWSNAVNWSDVNPAWPALPILRFSPGTDSGTFDYMVEFLFGAGKEEPILSSKNLQLSEDDNVLVQGVEGSPYAVGYFGYAYYAENEDKLKVLNVNGIEPTTANVDAATYPIARPLFLYSDARIMQDKPQVAAYINFYLTYVNEEIVSVGYFKANPEALKVAKQNWLTAMAGKY